MLAQIAELARQHNLVIFADEIYDKLIIDDDPQIRRFLRAGFDLEDFNVQEEQTGQAGLRSATLRQPTRT